MGDWDWSATPVGPPSGWPASLRSAVRMLLASRFSMWLGWGPELAFFYNDAYRRDTLRSKHPWALGRPAREVWAEIWDDIGPRIDGVLRSEQATWDEALLLFLERSGYPEETYHTFSYSPLAGDDGAVAGMLCVVVEETDRVIGERRMATLSDLGADLAAARTEDEVLGAICARAGENLCDLPFTLTYLFDGKGHARLAATSGIEAAEPAAPPELDLTAGAEKGWPVGDLDRGGPPVLVPDLATRFEGLPTGAWPEPPAQAVIAPLPGQGQGRAAGFVIAGLNRYRPFDANYRGFVSLLAGQAAAGLASARAYEGERERSSALAELDRAKTEFFSNVSHELRTPLTLIVGPADDALGDGADPLSPGQRERLELIRRNAGRLRRLVNHLLDFARLEGGHLAAEALPTDVARLTEGIAASFRPAVERAGLSFEVDCAALERTALVDRQMWEKIVLNLLSNAVKYTLAGGVRIALRGGAGGVELVVADTGVGIAADQVPLLFQRFHRVSGTAGRSHEGTGIGLALVSELAGLHGGSVAVHSTEGAGSTFTVSLPWGQGSDAPGALPAEAAAGIHLDEALGWFAGDDAEEPVLLPALAAGGTADRTVLVVDDNPEMRDYIARLLAPFWRVVTARNGEDALGIVAGAPPDLVLTDVMMPGVDGLGLLRALRSDPATATIPVIFVSARAGEASAVEGFGAGADDYLVKPFSALELVARIRANLEMAALRNQHAVWRRTIVESLNDAVVTMDLAGTVLEANPAFETMTGYDRRQHYTPPYPWWPDREEDPEAYADIEQKMAAVTRGEAFDWTVPFRRRDGRRLWAQGSLATLPDGAERRIVVVFRDVTAERAAAAQEEALTRFGIRLADAVDVDGVCEAALDEIRTTFGAQAALLVHAEVADGVAGPVTRAPADAAAAGPLTLTLQRVMGRLERAETYVELPVPPPAGGRPSIEGVGARIRSDGGEVSLGLAFDPPREWNADDRFLLGLLRGSLGQALRRARLFDTHYAVATAMQQALLGPTDVPAHFAVRYVPAVAPLEVGGDWYDVVELPGGPVGVVVGDCVGRGLSAATVMGQLRSAARALLLELEGPAAVLAALDTFAERISGAAGATVFCGVIEPATGRLRYSSAGHIPGVVVPGDGPGWLLEGAGSVPLATFAPGTRPEAETVLAPDSTLVVCTDGLIERRREPLDAGLGRLRAGVAAGRSLDGEALADDLLARLLPARGHPDDVALVVYRQRPPAG